MQNWLVENILPLLSMLVLGIVGFVKLLVGQQAHGKTLDDHLKDASPHPNCPAHSTAIISIKESLSEIKDRLGSIEQHLRNGRH